MTKLAGGLCLVIILVSCASVPAERPISVTVNATVAETKAVLIDTFFERLSDYPMQLIKATDYQVEFKAECVAVASPLECAGIMLSVGNSGWQGPFLHMEFVLVELDGQTKLRGNTKFCAINMAGMENCTYAQGADINNMNDILIAFQSFMEQRGD